MLVVAEKLSLSLTRISPPSTEAISASHCTLTFGEKNGEILTLFVMRATCFVIPQAVCIDRPRTWTGPACAASWLLKGLHAQFGRV